MTKPRAHAQATTLLFNGFYYSGFVYLSCRYIWATATCRGGRALPDTELPNAQTTASFAFPKEEHLFNDISCRAGFRAFKHDTTLASLPGVFEGSLQFPFYYWCACREIYDPRLCFTVINTRSYNRRQLLLPDRSFFPNFYCRRFW